MKAFFLPNAKTEAAAFSRRPALHAHTHMQTHTLKKGLVWGREGLTCASLATHPASQDSNRAAGVIRTGISASTSVGVDGAHEHTQTHTYNVCLAK